MFETGAMFETEHAFLNCHSRFSRALGKGLSVLILSLAVALMITSCGTVAQAAGTQNTGAVNNMSLYGNLPAGKVNESYNAVLVVIQGSFPYLFTVTNGALPPGISLNSATGAISGKPTVAGNFAFEVVVTDSPRLDRGSQTFAIVVGSDSGTTVKVGVSPASVTLLSNQKQQFTATVSGTSN